MFFGLFDACAMLLRINDLDRFHESFGQGLVTAGYDYIGTDIRHPQVRDVNKGDWTFVTKLPVRLFSISISYWLVRIV
jgi:hypothetical protein